MHERDLVSGMSVFVAVVETGSLAAAARRTRLTPSAVSKLVARLETRLGAQLLRRTTRSMTVTDAGQTFYERAGAVLAAIRGIEEEVAVGDVEPRGLVRVSASQFFGQGRVAPILVGFQKKFPRVSLDLDLTDRPVDMVGERTDVAVRITAAPPPSFVARRVGSIRRVLCASPAYLKNAPPPRRPGDLDRHSCLLIGGPSASPYWHFASDGAPRTSARIEPRLRVNSTLALHEAALAGLGIAELPSYLVEADLRARRLVRVLDQFAPTEIGVYVIYPPAALLPARVRALVKYLVPELEKVLRDTLP
jgi:DNA-binding transcriptional LysR family regulator